VVKGIEWQSEEVFDEHVKDQSRNQVLFLCVSVFEDFGLQTVLEEGAIG
jgi:hypothetical protein